MSQAVALARSSARQVARDYFEMTKPRVQTLLLFTTVTTMLVAGEPSAGLVALTCLGGAHLLTGRHDPRKNVRTMHDQTVTQLDAGRWDAAATRVLTSPFGMCSTT